MVMLCEIIDTRYDTKYNMNKRYSNVKMGLTIDAYQLFIKRSPV